MNLREPTIGTSSGDQIKGKSILVECKNRPMWRYDKELRVWIARLSDAWAIVEVEDLIFQVRA